MKDDYRNPNKPGEKNKDGEFENRRGVDMIADYLPSWLGGTAVKAKRKHKKQLEEYDK